MRLNLQLLGNIKEKNGVVLIMWVFVNHYFLFESTEDGHDVEIEIISHKDGVLSADFDLVSDKEESTKCKVVVHSRFLGE